MKYLLLIIVIFVVGCANKKDDKVAVINNKFNNSSRIQTLIQEKKRESTHFYEIIFDYKTLEGKGEQCHNLVKDCLTSLPEIKRCSKDSDCVIFPPMKNFTYESVNKQNKGLFSEKQKAVNKECFNNKAVIFINSGPLDRLIPYCSNDGYCGDFDTAEANVKKTSYLDDDGNTVEEITRIDSSEKTKTTIFKDKSIKVEISYGNIKKIIITDASGKTVKYEECIGDKCVDRTTEFKKNTDNIFDD
jgi:hypothetical protein